MVKKQIVTASCRWLKYVAVKSINDVTSLFGILLKAFPLVGMVCEESELAVIDEMVHSC